MTNWFTEHKIITGFIMAGLFFYFLISFGYMFSLMNLPSFAPEEKTYSNDNTLACVMAQDFISDYLNFPETADFPSCTKINIIYDGDQKYRVNGYVVSENAYGVKIKTDYWIWLKDNDGSWVMEDISI